MRERVLRHKPLLIFLVIYTLIFLILQQVMLYVIPFLISFIIAVVMKPLYEHLRRKFRFESAFAATVLTFLIFGAVFAVIGFLLYLIGVQAVSLYRSYGYLIEKYISSAGVMSGLRDALMSGSIFPIMSGVASAVFRTIPLMITFVIVSFAMTVFFLHHFGEIKAFVISKAGDKRREKTARVISTGYRLARRFIRSYLILYLITFVEAVFIFYLTGVPYPLPFAFVTAIADILPVLGPGTVYIPFAVSFFLQGNYPAAITLLIFFLITVILRQIIEPRIVSDSVKVNPMIILSAIYFSIVAMNIWILFYFIFLFMIHKVLVMSDVLPRISVSKAEE